jgi:hypothetical protein
VFDGFLGLAENSFRIKIQLLANQGADYDQLTSRASFESHPRLVQHSFWAEV